MRRKGMKRLTAVILTIMMVLQTGLYSVYASVPEIPVEANFSDGTGGGRAGNPGARRDPDRSFHRNGNL